MITTPLVVEVLEVFFQGKVTIIIANQYLNGHLTPDTVPRNPPIKGTGIRRQPKPGSECVLKRLVRLHMQIKEGRGT
jgi:hypothetical protein